MRTALVALSVLTLGVLAAGCADATEGELVSGDESKLLEDDTTVPAHLKGCAARLDAGIATAFDSDALQKVVEDASSCASQANDKRVADVSGASEALAAHRAASATLCASLPYADATIGGATGSLVVAACVGTFELTLGELIDVYVAGASSGREHHAELGDCFNARSNDLPQMISCVKAKADVLAPNLTENVKDNAEKPQAIDVNAVLTANVSLCAALAKDEAGLECQVRAAEQAFTMVEPYSRVDKEPE